MHNGHREQGQRIETQIIRQIHRACREKEQHNGHGRQTQSNGSQQINKTDRNISKNTTIIIPEHKIPAFKPAKVFMEDVKNAK